VLGRKDDLIVTSFGRNINPEWIENMLLDDSLVASCGIIGHGEPSLTAIFIPSASGKAWFAAASDAEVFGMIADRCATAPDYAVPKAFVAIPFAEAAKAGLLTRNGCFVRKTAAEFAKSSAARRAGEGPIPHPAQRNQ
jgi:long-subunit acyl-CoA synthetase (AMP-forming)